MQEKRSFNIGGMKMVVLFFLVVIASAFLIPYSVTDDAPGGVLIGILAILASLIGTAGFSIVPPNHSKVVTFLGRYLGTIRDNGFRWTYPLTRRRTVSLRVQNFDSNTLKVNDANGNPVEVAAVIVWRVVDSAKAGFEIEDYQSFVQIQTETAVRHMASMYPYDTYETGQTSLQANAEEVMADAAP